MSQIWQRSLAFMTSFALGAAIGSSIGYAFAPINKKSKK